MEWRSIKIKIQVLGNDEHLNSCTCMTGVAKNFWILYDILLSFLSGYCYMSE